MFKTPGDWTDLDRRFIRCRGAYRDFINTGLQPGAISQDEENRFNGFLRNEAVETARVSDVINTRLKPGVNETRRRRLVPKMPYAGEDHCHLSVVSGSNHFFITNRATRLNSAGCAGVRRRYQAVRERKESVARDGAAFERKPALLRFPNGNSRSVDTRHLAGANSKRSICLGVHDGI